LNRRNRASLLAIPRALLITAASVALAAASGALATAAAPGDTTGTAGAVTTTDSAAEMAAEDDTVKRWRAAVTLETSVGIGTFVSEPQNNPLVATSIRPSFSYEVASSLQASAAFSVIWYQVLDFRTPLKEHQFLMSDINLGLTHTSIYRHEDSGFNLSGSLSLGLPTSLASQFQNRLFTLAPSFSASIPVGPVTFSYTLGFGKYFNRTASASINCDSFSDPEQCRQGREDNPNFGFESERRGAEVFLPGAGTSSYYFQNALGVRWAIVDGLNLSLGVTVFNLFSTRAFPEDDLTNDNAAGGRSQTDRLVSSISLNYQIIRELGVGLSLVTATLQPFGAQGNDLVIFDFKRAPDNITTVNVSVTGSL